MVTLATRRFFADLGWDGLPRLSIYKVGLKQSMKPNTNAALLGFVTLNTNLLICAGFRSAIARLPIG